jgi:hypothetical protein
MERFKGYLENIRDEAFFQALISGVKGEVFRSPEVRGHVVFATC